MPIDPLILPAFLLAIALVELTPGPNMGYLAVLSASRGRAAGLSAVAGVTLGLGVYMVAAAVGVTEALLAFPALFDVLRWAGVGYILWLALEAWRGATETSPGHAWRIAGDRYFWRGFLANVLNPKAAVFYVLLIPGFLAEDRASPLIQTMVLGSIHLLVSLAVHSAIVLFAAGLGGVALSSADHDRNRVLRRVSAVALAAVAAWLAVDTAH